MPTHSDVWKQIKNFLDDGVSVIPIRDKDETKGGKVFTKKSPYISWKEFQTRIASEQELYHALETYSTTAIATLCGKVSGNMEAIDVDVKHNHGIGEQLLAEIERLLPEIYIRLRVNRSPSGGYHILYRVGDHEIGPSKKIASREATESELKIKPDEKYKCFIETRGEGGYVAAPPTLGYEKIRDVPLPILTWEERCSVMAICESYNEIIKKEKDYTQTKSDSIYYSVNPFESFNKSSAAERVLLDNGWSRFGENRKGILFTRPGSKSKGIHAIMFFDSNLYFFFTTNSQFENEKCYNPSTVKAELEFAGDKKKLHQWLSNNGYGQLTPDREKEIVRRAAMLKKELPKNISEQGKKEYQEQQQRRDELHSYGIFWFENERRVVEIDRDGLMHVATKLGYRNYKNYFVQIIGNIVYKRDARNFFDEIKNYIKEDDGDFLSKVYNAYELFIEKHGKFVIERMQLIPPEDFLQDAGGWCYKFFENGYLFITREEISFNQYERMAGLILDEKIQKRSYIQGEPGGAFFDFVKLAMRYNEKQNYVESIIGYLAHDYKDESTGYIIVLTEEAPDPKDGGGSGKNVFTNMFKCTTTLVNKAGAQVSYDEKFLQSWNGERIFALNDVPKKFNFAFLKEMSTGNGTLKKLFKDEIPVPVEDMPKFIIQTNFGVVPTDGGLARRIIYLEFTNFFTLCKGVDAHFNKMFPTDFVADDWSGYDNFIAKCVQTWLLSGRKLNKEELSEGGWRKQYEQEHKYVIDFFEKNWDAWAKEYFVSNKDFEAAYMDYRKENHIPDLFQMKPKELVSAFRAFAEHKKYKFVNDHKKRINGSEPIHGKSITPIDPPF